MKRRFGRLPIEAARWPTKARTFGNIGVSSGWIADTTKGGGFKFESEFRWRGL